MPRGADCRVAEQAEISTAPKSVAFGPLADEQQLRGRKDGPRCPREAASARPLLMRAANCRFGATVVRITRWPAD